MILYNCLTLSIALASIHDFTSKSNKSLSQASSVILSTVDFLVSYRADEPTKHFPVSAINLKSKQRKLYKLFFINKIISYQNIKTYTKLPPEPSESSTSVSIVTL